ncbi:MAG TPA: hypothetical protein VIX19_12195 [Terriglobales bacterium]
MGQKLKIATLFFAASMAGVAQTPNSSPGSSSRLYRQGNEWVQEISGTLPARRVVRVKSSAGSIKVQGGTETSVSFTVREHIRAATEEAAKKELSRLKFSTYSAGETVLRAECEGSNHGYIDFDLQIPSQTAAVKLETDGGAVTAKNLSGRIDVATGGGDIWLDQIGGLVSVASGGGNIEIGKAGNDVSAATGGGNIHIDSAAGKVTANSGGGNLRVGEARVMFLQTGGGWIQVSKCQGQIKAETGGGSIELKEILGAAQIESGGGGIRVGPIRGGVHAETGSGPIVATLAGGKAFTDSRLETTVGDITVYVPDGLGVTVRANVDVARGYGIHSDFPELKITSSNNVGPREAFAEGSINGGGPILHVHTSTGNIVFKRKDKQ